jgi:hypothetical protein
MADITKKVHRDIDSTKRYQYWASSENADDGTAIAAGDIFKIEKSLGHPARYVYIETDTSTVLSIRLNSQVRRYPWKTIDRMAPPGNRAVDIENVVTWTDDTQAAIPISDGSSAEIIEFNQIIPISDIELVTFSSGSFILLCM